MSLSVPLHHLGVSGLLQHEYSRPHQVHEIRGEAACPFGELIGTVLNRWEPWLSCPLNVQTKSRLDSVIGPLPFSLEPDCQWSSSFIDPLSLEEALMRRQTVGRRQADWLSPTFSICFLFYDRESRCKKISSLLSACTLQRMARECVRACAYLCNGRDALCLWAPNTKPAHSNWGEKQLRRKHVLKAGNSNVTTRNIFQVKECLANTRWCWWPAGVCEARCTDWQVAPGN